MLKVSPSLDHCGGFEVSAATVQDVAPQFDFIVSGILSMSHSRKLLLTLFALSVAVVALAEDQLTPIKYNNPGLVVDLGVGLWAWPLPMDHDGDGDMDLIVSCPDVPFSGTYFFENKGASRVEGLGSSEKKPSTLDTRRSTLPIFEPPVRIANKMSNVQVSYIDGKPIVSTSGKIFLDFPKHQYSKPINLGLPTKLDLPFKRTRANQWKLVDWENDGDLDVIVGLGVWDEYGWDDAWDEEGNWKNGPLHGYVYLVENVAGGSRGEGLGAEGSREEKSGGVGERAASSTLDAQRSTKQVWKSLPAKELWPEFLGPRPKFAKPVQIQAGGKPVDVYGMPSPNFSDFDEDGDLDLICGEFMDGFTWFENVGSRAKPNFRAGTKLKQRGEIDRKLGELKMNLQMITPVAIDWDSDGDVDLICGDEDGRVALIANGSKAAEKRARFSAPAYFKQVAEDLKFGALVTPVSIDVDKDGDEDIVAGDSAGHIAIFENLGGNSSPKFSEPKLVNEFSPSKPSQPLSQKKSEEDVDRSPETPIMSFPPQIWGGTNRPLRRQAGQKLSIQGPCEAKWGYTTIGVSDWDQSGNLDIVVNGIAGGIFVYRDFRRDDEGNWKVKLWEFVKVDWKEDPPKPAWTWWTPNESVIATQWRTTPCTLDWNEDGLTDLVMLDHEGYLAFYERTKKEDELILKAPKRIFKIEGKCEFDSRHRNVGEKKDDLLRLNAGHAGASGRRKLHFVDWDGDGRKDLLVNSTNVNWLKNVRTDEDGFVWFKDMGPMDTLRLAGHTTSPTTVDWDKNGIPDLLVGAEDGRMYYKKNPRAK